MLTHPQHEKCHRCFYNELIGDGAIKTNSCQRRPVPSGFGFGAVDSMYCKFVDIRNNYS